VVVGSDDVGSSGDAHGVWRGRSGSDARRYVIVVSLKHIHQLVHQVVELALQMWHPRIAPVPSSGTLVHRLS
jgi:hypothetical protein